jgi:hypothetical protein
MSEGSAAGGRPGKHTQKLLEDACTEGKQASEAQRKLEAHAEADAASLCQTAERMAQAQEELRLLPSPVPAGPISEIALWYADALRQLGALLGMLKQRLAAEREHIVEIIGATILPRVQWIKRIDQVDMLHAKLNCN